MSALQMVREAQNHLCLPEWCFVCSRPTDHSGEHSTSQILSRIYVGVDQKALRNARIFDAFYEGFLTRRLR